MTIVENQISPETFTSLRKTGPFVEYASGDIELALRNSLYSVLVLDDDGRPVAMARLVGDGRICFFIKDFVVIPEEQNRKIGTLVMKRLFAYIRDHACANAYVGLMSTPRKEGFYEKFGFIRRPNDRYGAGMVLYYNGEEI